MTGNRKKLSELDDVTHFLVKIRLKYVKSLAGSLNLFFRAETDRKRFSIWYQSCHYFFLFLALSVAFKSLTIFKSAICSN